MRSATQRILSRKISDETFAKLVIQPISAVSWNWVPIEPPPTWKLIDTPASWAAAQIGSQWVMGQRRHAVVLGLVAEVDRLDDRRRLLRSISATAKSRSQNGTAVTPIEPLLDRPTVQSVIQSLNAFTHVSTTIAGSPICMK